MCPKMAGVSFRRMPRLSRRPLAAVAAALVLAGSLAACAGKQAVGGTDGGFRYVSGTKLGTTYALGSRKLAGDFTAGLLDGNGSYTLSQDRGKVVVINYWASWCGPCVIESPQFDLVYRAYKSKGVNFVGVDTKDARSHGQYFVKNHNISYPSVFDEPGQTAVELGKIPLPGLPSTVLIDKHGKVAGVYGQTMSPKDIEPLLDKLVAEA